MRAVVIEGDSIAFGMFDHEQGGWAHRLHTESLALSANRMHDPSVVRNYAVPGMTLSGILHFIEDHTSPVRGARRKATVLSVGLNESKIFPGHTRPSVDLKLFGHQLMLFNQLAEIMDLKQLYIGPAPVIEEKTRPSPTGCYIEDDLLEEYDAVIAGIARNSGVPYISTRELFSGHELPDVIDDDGRHPNTLGHTLLHHAVSASLQSMNAL